VTDPDGLQSAIRATVDKFGRLDVLHNNAGGSTAQDDTAVNAPLDEFWRAIKLDLYGTFLGRRFGIPELIKAGGGSVINMSSNVALMGVAGRDCYTAATGGIAAITRSLAVAYAPQRVRVNAKLAEPRTSLKPDPDADCACDSGRSGSLPAPLREQVVCRAKQNELKPRARPPCGGQISQDDPPQS
jgi:NAD(P)-dependent dehydrogenase (short-subunit alcohol dehydrogenase family)